MFKELDEFLNITKTDKSVHTLRSYKTHLSIFVNALSVSKIEDVEKLTAEEIRLHFFSRKEGGLKESSVNGEIRVVKAFMNFLLENGYIKNNVSKSIKFMKEPKKVVTLITTDERNAMIMSCKSLKMKLMVAMLFYLGLRRAEIAEVKINDFKDGRLLVHGKGRKERSLAVHPYILDLKDQYLKHRNSDYEYLFGSRQGFGGVGSGEWHPITVAAVRNAVKRSAELAGIDVDRIEKIHPHALRKNFACSLASQGNSAFQIQKALGHSSILTTQIYISPAGAEIADSALLGQDSPE